MPDRPRVSPELAFRLSFLVQHNRLWVVVAVQSVAILMLLSALWVQSRSFEPSTVLVDLASGQPVVLHDAGEVQVGRNIYNPVRLRKVVTDFVDARYAYTWRDPQRVNEALNLMTQDGKAEEIAKLRNSRILEQVVASKAVTKVFPQLSEMEIQSAGDGEFKVTLPLQLERTDEENPDHPLVEQSSVELRVKSVPMTDTNPWGYVIQTAEAL